MRDDDLCVVLAEKYYQDIYRYCYAKLNYDENAAQDCTQEVFFVLVRKRDTLNLAGNMRVWLYKTADRVIKHYWRMEKRRKNQVPIDDVELSDDGGISALFRDSLFECLTDQEYELLSEYYNAPFGSRNELAQKHGMTIYELYREIERIKVKVRSSE